MSWSLKRTYWAAGAASSVLAVVALAGTVTSLHFADAARDAGASRYQSFLLADEMRQSSDDLTRLARTFVVSGGEAKWEQQYFEILDIRNGKKARPAQYERIYWDFRAAGTELPAGAGEAVPLLDLMKRAGFSDAELAKLDEAKANSDDLVRTETVAMNLVKGLKADGSRNDAADRDADQAKARAMMHDLAYHQNKAKIMKPVNEFLALLDERTATELATATVASERWARVSAGSVVALVVLVLGMLVVVQRRSSQVIGDAARVIDGIAQGDLRQSIDAGDQSQEGRLLASLAAMQAHLAAVVGSIRTSADAVATASTQIAQGNNDLSQRTEEQASSLQQTAASMEELGTTVRLNADNARQADQLAQGATSIAGRGGEVVGQVVGTMKDINESSRRIADIIGVIDGIAFQTNILALNAAVEAARAGEQGRGFAVVAGEVRSLAQRSAEAAREIKSLITASVERVERGTSLADQAGTTMQDIVQSIQRVTDIVGEITTACIEQSQGVQQVGQAVSQMDQATQHNAALVEESAAAAESLRQQAHNLVQAVATFRLAADAGRPLAARTPPAATPARAMPAPVAVRSSDPKPLPAARPTSPTPPTKVEAPPVTGGARQTATMGEDDWQSF
jgi:methyl-accepting chemotaxis protein